MCVAGDALDLAFCRSASPPTSGAELGVHWSTVSQQLQSAGVIMRSGGPRAHHLTQLTGAVALRLDVGLPDHILMLDAHDIDNYALPLAHCLTTTQSLDFVSIWATKSAADTSLIRSETATHASLPGPFDYHVTVRTTASASTMAYKQQVSTGLTDAAELPPGPIAMELAFVVGPRRNWLNLWKPTIDALDRLLGRTYPDREWHARRRTHHRTRIAPHDRRDAREQRCNHDRHPSA